MTVVLLQGFADDSSWLPALAHGLAGAGHRVITYAHRPHGPHRPGDAPTDLALSGPAVLVAAPSEALAALTWTLTRPRRVAGLAFLDGDLSRPPVAAATLTCPVLCLHGRRSSTVALRRLLPQTRTVVLPGPSALTAGPAILADHLIPWLGAHAGVGAESLLPAGR